MGQLQLGIFIILLLTATAKSGLKQKCSANDPKAMLSLGQDTNEFGWNLWKEIAKSSSNDNENIFFSPASISATFGMLYLGTKGNSSKEVKQTFFPKVEERSVPSAYLSLMSKLKPNPKHFNLSIANAAFVEKTAQLRDSYTSVVKKCFRSEVSAADFKNKPDEERAKINSWVSDKTQGKIMGLLPPKSVEKTTNLILANAIHFKGTWLWKFQKSDNRNMTFHGFNNVSTKTEMMTIRPNRLKRNVEFPFFEDKKRKIKIIELPYVGKDISMIILLPENQAAFKKTQRQISAYFVRGLKAHMIPTSQLAYVAIPKWKDTRTLDLVSDLQKLKLTTVFGPKADLSGIATKMNLTVSGAFHKAFIEVNEEGTEASAATAIVQNGVGPQMPTLPPPTFVANKPFIYMIWHKPTKTALFIGRLASPK